MSRRVGSIALAALGVVLQVAQSSAQQQVESRVALFERPSWGEFALPSNFAGSPTVQALGHCITFQTQTHVYLWSAITMQWVVVPATPTAQVTQFNEYITIEDGSTLHGFATRTGAVQTLHLSATPQVFHGSTSSNWLSIAVLGTEAWSFAAFDGTWKHELLAGAPSNILISQLAGVFSDGVDIYGVSAYYGDFVKAPLSAGATLGLGGDNAVAWTTTSVAGFSANTNQWRATPLSNPVSLALDRGYSMFTDGANLVAFSACTGTFASHAIASGFSFTAGRYVAAARVGNDVIAYSSGQGTFQQRSFASPPTVVVDDEVLAVSDSVGVTAFSVVTGEFSNTVLGAFSVQTNDAVVWINDGVHGQAYCPITGTWNAAPVPLTSTQVSVMRNVIVLSDASGYRAFSGRTGAWVSQPVVTPFNYFGSTSSDLFVAFDGLQTYVFDPVIVRWARTQTSAPVQSFDVWRQTFVGFDGVSAVGFGLMNNAWSSIATRGVFQRLDANSECGYVLTNSHVYAYSAQGSLSTLSRFPEFSRLQPIGVPLRLIEVAAPGSHVLAVLAHDAGYQPLPNGTLFIDPTTTFLQIPLGTVPASGVLDFPLDLSVFPSLAGTAVHIQTFVTPPGGAPRWIANSISPVVL